MLHNVFKHFELYSYHPSRGSPIGSFNPVIPTQNFVQSRNLEGCFWYLTSLTNFPDPESRPDFALESRARNVGNLGSQKTSGAFIFP